MREDLKTILFMGLGALAETNDKMKEVSDDLYKKGKDLYEKGVIANEELKHKINEAMKENGTCEIKKEKASKEDILKNIENLSQEEREELLKLLGKKGWSCEKQKDGKGNKEN